MLRRKFSLPVLIFTLIVGTTLGFWMPRDDDFFALRKNFEIFGAAYEELVTGYVEPLDAEHLMRTGLDAMLNELDPYTTFIDEADNADLSIITRGQYGGVGLNVGRRGGKITVISPIEGASGYKQGVRAGDIITRIEDQPTTGLSMNDVRNLLRGEPGTTVDVTVEREGEPDPIVFTLTREQVHLENVTYSGYVDPAMGAGYVKLERFAREAGDDVQHAIEQLRQDGTLNGLILDLRDNPGGLLDAAVDVSELFVEQGAVIVSTRGRAADSERVYRSERAPIAPALPLVVLVNGYSASASEIVAGAVQDLDRGVVMGTTTYGKGLVQVVKSLPYNTSLKMTTAKYYTPSGRSIQSIEYQNGEGIITPDSVGRAFETRAGRTVRDRHGIEPDIPIDATTPSELEEALQRRAAFFFFANHFAAEHDTIAPDFRATDALLDDFQAWLEAENFDYRTDGERSVSKLQDEFASIGYEAVQDEIVALRRAVEAEKQAGFERHAADLKHHLQEEILARFVSESEQIRAALHYDLQVQEAVSLLRNRDSYSNILTVR